MAATKHLPIELSLNLRISKQAARLLTERAEASGLNLGEYISALAEQASHKPLTLAQISGPVYGRFRNSGLSDADLADLLEEEKHDARSARRTRRAS